VDPVKHVLTASVYRHSADCESVILSAVCSTARNPAPRPTSRLEGNLRTDLMHQAMDATLGHAQRLQSPTDAQLLPSSISNSHCSPGSFGTISRFVEQRRATGGPINLGAALLSRHQ
jgi:hypothetical protein